MVLALGEKPRFRNKMEEDFARHLEGCTASGKIQDWWYEPALFNLGGGVRVLPDFGVLTSDNEFVLYETKGYKRQGSLSKLKLLAHHLPFRVILVTRNSRTKEWIYAEVRG